MRGQLISFYLPFMENDLPLSSQEQAKRILKKAEEILKEVPFKGVAITYSANYDQTLRIRDSYASGKWLTGTNGANQASVIHAMETLLREQYSHLQYKIEIAPITTLTYSDFKGKSHEQIIREDLAAIEELIKNGWYILGWKNQVSFPEFAIGGGIACLPVPLSRLVQQQLSALETN